jgi:methionine synthase II (cobalamin-independent)
MAFEPQCLATTIGSLPHSDTLEATRLMLRFTPRIPAWVQLSKRPQEGMLVQFTEGLPGFHRPLQGGNYFDVDAPSFQNGVSALYENYLAVFEEHSLARLESYAISRDYARGFHALLELLTSEGHRPQALKGQVTGPFTFGTSVTDGHGKSAYYDGLLRDIIVKSISLKAAWQIEQLRPHAASVIISIDEPSLVGFGSSAYIGITADDIRKDLNEIIGCIHQAHGYAGLHCCENTDWSVVLGTGIDIISFDAYSYFDKLLLYADALRDFLARGGILSWGLVPTADPALLHAESTGTLLDKWHSRIEQLAQRGIAAERIAAQSLITPSCGAGLLSPRDAELVLRLLSDLSRSLQHLYFG